MPPAMPCPTPSCSGTLAPVRIGLALAAALLGAAAAGGVVVRPLGQMAVLGSGPCGGGTDKDCYQVEVDGCPGVALPEGARLGVGSPTGGAPYRGTILLLKGGGGEVEWSTFGPYARQAIADLRAAGFTTVELDFDEGWLVGSSVDEGHGLLACRVATITRELFTDEDGLGLYIPGYPYCATGNSAGSSAFSYAIAHYGLDEILDAVVLSSGPVMTRIDWGCLPAIAPDPNMQYLPSAANLYIDRAFGFPGDNQGPCVNEDLSFATIFRDASITWGDWDYYHPRTMLGFLYGTEDDSGTDLLVRWYWRLLKDAGNPLMYLTLVPNSGHKLPESEEGAEAVRAALVEDCVVRHAAAP